MTDGHLCDGHVQDGHLSDGAREETTIEQTVRIAASPETVWGFWTDRGRLCEWWGREAEVVAEPGGCSAWSWRTAQ